MGSETVVVPIETPSPSCFYVTDPKGLETIAIVAQMLNKEDRVWPHFTPKVRACIPNINLRMDKINLQGPGIPIAETIPRVEPIQ
jgi:hypothetical protein